MKPVGVKIDYNVLKINLAVIGIYMYMFIKSYQLFALLTIHAKAK